MSKILNIGIVGLRHLHPESYMPLLNGSGSSKVVSVCEKDALLLKSFSERHGINGYDDLDKMLDCEQLDIAVIFLPHVDCADAAVKCAQRKVNLMVEKPVAEGAASASRILEAVKANGVKFTTGYCWRFHPAAVEIKKMIEAGVIGEVVGAQAKLAAGRVDRYIAGNSSWMLEKAKSGGGPMYNLGVHWIDLLMHVFDDEITEVSGTNTKVNTEYDIEDNSFALMKFSKGCVATLDVSYTMPDSFPHGRDLLVEVRGTKGVISWAPGYEGEKGSGAGGQRDIIKVCSDSAVYAGSSNRELAFELNPTNGYSGYMGRAYVDSFIQAVLEDTEPMITCEEAIKVLQVVEAIYESDERKCWVKV